MKLVIHPPVDPQRLQLIEEAAGDMLVINAADEQAALEQIADADAFFGKITTSLLAAANQLRWVQSPTASLEHYLFPELVAHPCLLSNMRGLFSDVIADHVMAYVLMFARNLHHYQRRQLAREWAPVGGEEARTGFVTGAGLATDIDRSHLHLSDCTLGVVGCGSIGAEVCRRASAFGMHIVGIDPQVREVPDVVSDVWPLDWLPVLLRESDFVVIAAPHTPETERMFRAEQFALMKSTAYLINIGRGAIVDLNDLTQALEEGQLAGAALDVFEIEPLPGTHPLWEMENVIITPHVAAASPRIAERHTQTLLENIRRFVAGEEPATLVDKTRWY